MVFSCEVVLQAQSLAVKRSPLEVGYATFPNEILKRKHVSIANKLSDEGDGDTALSAAVSKVHHTQEWVPGTKIFI